MAALAAPRLQKVDVVNIAQDVDLVNIYHDICRMTIRKRPYHHGDLRAALLDEATRMIAEEGTESVTMRAIGRRLDVSRSAAYRHFPNKEALLVAVATQGFTRLHALLQAIDVAGADSDVAQLRQMGETYLRFAVENPARYRLMYGNEALKRERYPQLQSAANGLLEELVQIIMSYQRAGAIKNHDARSLAYVAWSAVHGLASLVIDGQMQAPHDLDALTRLTTQTLIEGMKS